MSQPAANGVLIYARQLDGMSAFYQRVLGLREVHADATHRVLAGVDVQLLLHALPPGVAAQMRIASPPEPRETQAIKPFFTVPSLAEAEREVEACGGLVHGPIWPGPGLRVRNVCDPEGNLLHLRERVG
jgi:predicted enzyme related to lactoylglutathione lyase